MTDAQGNVTTLGYDLLGQKTSIADPDLRNWAYQYDLAGNLTRQTDARGQRICLYYDALHRLTGKHYRSDDACPTSPTLDVSYRYDEGANGKGQRTSMTDGTGTTSWTYDVRGRVTNETQTVSGYGTYTTQYGYDSIDRIRTITYPGGPNGESGEVVTQSYDLGGQLSGVSGTNSYASGMTYDPLGLIKQVSRGDGSVTTYVYCGEGDPFQAAKSYRLWRINHSLWDVDYGYEAVGTINHIWLINGTGQNFYFGYDELDRLTSVTGAASQTFAYNLIGNITDGPAGHYEYRSTDIMGYPERLGELRLANR